ncbi:hypothetical protein MGN70_008806 [Eutypa lata]|nr:hypothetical protein MGN70_008806 [Eutypa lata]
MEAVAVAPSATFLSCCPASNFISSRNGNGMNYVYEQTATESLSTSSLSTTDAEGCRLSSTCAVFAWYSGSCFFIGTDACAPAEVLALYSAPNDAGFVRSKIGNGNCGRTR